MTAKPGCVRQIANRLALAVLADQNSHGRDWAVAMASEIDAIESDWSALWFALGCWQVSARRTSGVSSLARFGVFGCFAGWAAAKAYLAVLAMGWGSTAELPSWIVISAAMSGLAYLAAGAGVLARRWAVIIGAMGLALCTNAVTYGLSVLSLDAPTLWVMALAGEDYVVWTLLGLAIVALGQVSRMSGPQAVV